MGDIQSQILTWYDGLPPVTRWWLSLAVALNISGHWGLLPEQYLVFSYDAIVHHFHLWRLVTSLLWFGGLGFHFLFMMSFLARYPRQMEENAYQGRTADFLVIVMFNAVILYLGVGVLLGFHALGEPLLMSMLYIWSRRYPNIPMSFWFGIKFMSVYFPWVLVGFYMLLGQFPLIILLGIAVGHLYYFLEDIFPAMPNGRRLLWTPAWLYKLFPPGRGAGGGVTAHAPAFAAPGANQPPGTSADAGHRWGRGQTLGRE